jgi:hypothetical protein
MQITTIGLDLAKNVFQVHGVDATGQVVVRKSLRRSQMPNWRRHPQGAGTGVADGAADRRWQSA